MNKLMKKIVMGALTFTMVLGTVLSVSAAAIPTPMPRQDDGKAILEKVLKTADGVTIVNPTLLPFDFKFTPKGIVGADGKIITGTDTDLPAIANYILNASQVTGDPQIVNGFVETKVLTNDVLAGLPATGFDHAGVYVYEVSEVILGTPGIPYSYENGEVTFSQAVYQMIVYVQNKVDGDSIPLNPEELEITNVGFRKIVEDNGVAVAEVASGVNDMPIHAGGMGDAMFTKTSPIFTNEFSALVDLTVSKTVAGEYADTTEAFKFDLTLERPNSQAVKDETTTGKTYTGYIVDIDGNATNPPRKVVATFAPNSTTTTIPQFTLKHGESVIFRGYEIATDPAKNIGTDITGLPAGTIWTIGETGVAGYTATATVNNNFTGTGTPVPGTGTAGDSLSITTLGTNALVAGEDTNEAAFLNTYRAITPTGILMNNLPFILLILVAVGGFVGYIASKRRKAMN